MQSAKLNRFFLHIVMPSIVAIGLFILSIFLVILPAFEKNIMAGKKEMISELTNSVCSLLDEYYQEAMNGLIPPDSARALAVDRVRQIRYGEESKDYFWIIDERPSMIMHPYRTELIGQDLNGYEDSDGKLLFVEAVKVVDKHGEGFIDYMWQWKDDSTRTVPKLSYVKAFRPWNWIVGTGIYLEDVRLEIHSLKKRLLGLSLLISLLISAILIFIIRQSLNIEKRKEKVEEELRRSREKYKSLVEASTEGTLMMVEHAFVFSNLKFSDLSGYDPSEIRRMSFGDIFQLDWKSLEREITDPVKSISRETVLNCKDGNIREVVLSTSRIKQAGRVGYIIIIKEISNHMQYEIESDHLAGELRTALQMMNQPLKSIARNILQCPSTTSVQEASILMARKQQDLLFIHQKNQIIGVISNNDLVNRALASGVDQEEQIISIMSAPVVSLPENALLYEGLHLMVSKNISHISLTDPHRKIIGVAGFREFVAIQQNMVNFLVRDIEFAEGTTQIRGLYKRLPVMVKALVDSGSNTGIITRIITSVADAIHQRLITLALEELGPAPCKFAFMVLGSQGRAEQTLATDQDNAIVFEDLPDDISERAREYFNLLGEKVNLELDAVGYQYCPGEIMARNQKWTQNLGKWKAYFSQWISNSNPEDILDAAIFFDFRCVYGDALLEQELRDHVYSASENKSVFFYHMAQTVLKMKPPTLATGSDNMDLKKALLPVSTFIRLYSIREKISENNSMKRTEILRERKLIDQSTYEELTYAFNYLTLLRIKTQANSIARNEVTGNSIEFAQLNRIEIVVLKKLFSDIAGLQTRLSSSFNVTE